MTALESPDETESKGKSDEHGARTENQLGSKRAAYSEHHILLLSNPSDVRASKRARNRAEINIGRFTTKSARRISVG